MSTDRYHPGSSLKSFLYSDNDGVERTYKSGIGVMFPAPKTSSTPYATIVNDKLANRTADSVKKAVEKLVDLSPPPVPIPAAPATIPAEIVLRSRRRNRSRCPCVTGFGGSKCKCRHGVERFHKSGRKGKRCPYLTGLNTKGNCFDHYKSFEKPENFVEKNRCPCVAGLSKTCNCADYYKKSEGFRKRCHCINGLGSRCKCNGSTTEQAANAVENFIDRESFETTSGPSTVIEGLERVGMRFKRRLIGTKKPKDGTVEKFCDEHWHGVATTIVTVIFILMLIIVGMVMFGAATILFELKPANKIERLGIGDIKKSSV